MTLITMLQVVLTVVLLVVLNRMTSQVAMLPAIAQITRGKCRNAVLKRKISNPGLPAWEGRGMSTKHTVDEEQKRQGRLGPAKVSRRCAANDSA